MSQKDIFLSSEGDRWFDRNKSTIGNYDPIEMTEDQILALVQEFLPFVSSKVPSLLEVGCGGGNRLKWSKDQLGVDAHGIDPSPKAIQNECSKGVAAQIGTADNLPFLDCSFDFLVFGHCLYLCDVDDLFKISSEATRVTKKDSFIIIHDFFAPEHKYIKYEHKAGIFSHKMDFTKLWSWQSSYTVIYNKLTETGSKEFRDDDREWVTTSVLRKKTNY